MSSVVVEMWAWYALTVLIVAARLLSRRMFFKSFRRLQADDWLMVFTICVHTALLVIVWIQTYTPTNLLNPAEPMVLTPAEIRLREYGSKLVLVTEHLQMVVIWSVKGCLLIMYSRLTTSLRQNLLVKIVAVYVVLSFIVMEILWFVWCRPFHYYWKVPPPDLNCSAETNHMITNAVFNISSDIMILFIPMPVFLQSQLPARKKIILCGVFGLGIFTIVAAILSKYYSLGSPYGTQWIFWYIREVSTAIITANLPLTWTLLQSLFGLSSFYSSKFGKSSGQHTSQTHGGNRFRSAYGNLASGAREVRPKKETDPYHIDVSPSESQEQINTEQNNTGIPLKIWQHHEIRITAEEVGENERDNPPKRPNGPTGPFHDGPSPTGSLAGDKSLGDVELGSVTKVTGGV
ncbi:hypothetical protein S40285_00015 [Stachybotrys chlorohalonatus IBT 40285]|uniref:Rhodopsin domain-containing protein n=1 Tax=Stachybotrys chlorohalonatus (strain IBT 40285) TaxID=1283841 RepID=A0A084QZ12_STAC4|nr:hypothetical protein S40285_00015 [Stachybotrys chlorohalonata IBT 40285]